MRLIDADKLIDYFYYGENDKPIIDGIADRKIIGIIQEQPTVKIVQEVAKEYVPDTNVGKWIPCSERLPEESKTKSGHIDPSEEVLVYIYYGENCVSNGFKVSRYWSHSEGFSNPWIDLNCDKENVIAWKPIAPYQKGE